VNLFKGDKLVKENTDKEIAFDSLDYYTEYTLNITYTFDVNDGKGVQEKTVEQNVSTLPYLDTKAFLVRNPMLFEEDSCYIQIDIDNPLKLTVTHVTINGKEYAVLPSSTTDTLIVEMSCKGLGGSISLSAEKFKAKLDGNIYDIPPTTICEDTVFVNGTFEVIDIEITNKEGAAIYWLFPSEKCYIKIRVNNPTGYDVTEISISGNTVNVTEANKITNNEYLICCERYVPYDGKISISYKNQYASKTLVSSVSNYRITLLTSDEIRYISTVDDLKNAHDCYYYELANDIDLLGVNWTPIGFIGALNGNGYAIKNMMLVGEMPDTGIGLFGGMNGTVCNLTIDNAFIMSSSNNGSDDYHALIAKTNSGTILSCTINSSSTINCENEYVSGFAGTNNGMIKGCVNNANIASSRAAGIAGSNSGAIISCTNNGEITGGNWAFGISYGTGGGEDRIWGCTNNGNIYSSFMACGIIDYSKQLYNCINNGNISGDWAYGIAHAAYVYNCMNTGTIESHTSATASGIGGPNLSGEAVNCLNIGGFKGNGINAAVAYEDECYNCYTIKLDGNVIIGPAQLCSVEQLNSKEFYTETLGWSEDVWDLSDLDIENGKYPKLK